MKVDIKFKRLLISAIVVILVVLISYNFESLTGSKKDDEVCKVGYVKIRFEDNLNYLTVDDLWVGNTSKDYIVFQPFDNIEICEETGYTTGKCINPKYSIKVPCGYCYFLKNDGEIIDEKDICLTDNEIEFRNYGG